MLKKYEDSEPEVTEEKPKEMIVNTPMGSVTRPDVGLKMYEYVEITVDKDLDGKEIPELFDGENFTLFEINKDGTCIVIGPNGYTGKFSPGMLKNKDGGDRYVK